MRTLLMVVVLVISAVRAEAEEPEVVLGAMVVSDFEKNEVKAEKTWLGRRLRALVVLQSVQRGPDGKPVAYLTAGRTRLGQFYCTIDDATAASADVESRYILEGVMTKNPQSAPMGVPSFLATSCTITAAPASTVARLCPKYDRRNFLNHPSECPR